MKPLPCLALFALAACGPTAVKSTPDPIRFAPVAAPVVPDGESPCPPEERAAGEEKCLSDRQIGALIDGLIDALERANAKLSYLGSYYLKP